MTNVIEFYVPVRFRKALKWVPQQHRGRVLKFSVAKKRTAWHPGAQKTNCNHQEKSIGAAVAFADLGDFRATSFPNVSRLEADQFYFEPEISSHDCFEDIVGKSPALQKVLEHGAVVAPTDFTVLLQGDAEAANFVLEIQAESFGGSDDSALNKIRQFANVAFPRTVRQPLYVHYAVPAAGQFLKLHSHFTGASGCSIWPGNCE